MAIAGRVAIVPKGEWSQSVTYDKLDLVTHNGNTFIAYKSSVGVEPVDGDTWMLVMQGIDPQDIENIIDGTIPVGDSNKLGGKGASEYALGKDYLPKTGGEIKSSITTMLDLNTTYSEPYGFISFKQNGTLLGRLGIGGKDNPIFQNAAGNANYPLLHTGNVGSYALPINGTGTMTGAVNLGNGLGYVHSYSNKTELEVKNSADDTVNKRRLTLWNKSQESDINNALMLYERKEDDSGWNRVTLLHTGNKPTGSYTGTGANRTVPTGGLGQACLVYDSDSATYLSIVTTAGTIGRNSDGLFSIDRNVVRFQNGNLIINSADRAWNASGITYAYQVL